MQVSISRHKLPTGDMLHVQTLFLLDKNQSQNLPTKETVFTRASMTWPLPCVLLEQLLHAGIKGSAGDSSGTGIRFCLLKCALVAVDLSVVSARAQSCPLSSSIW